jgi:hypothetical protein
VELQKTGSCNFHYLWGLFSGCYFFIFIKIIKSCELWK